MKITFLGTAAAEGVPAIFCQCPSCQYARKFKGKNIRTRSQILIGDDMLIDFPMDSYLHTLKYNLDLTAVKNIFITHAHMDHLYPMEIALRGEPYSHNMTHKIVNIYGNQTVTTKFNHQIQDELHANALDTFTLNTLKPYQSVATEDYLVTALPAVHTVGEQCLVYMIQSKDKTALILNDTGILPLSVYQYIGDQNIKLDLVSFDCTYGYKQKGEGRHMGALDAQSERDKMKSVNIVHDKTKYILTHFSHNGVLPYKEFANKVKRLNFIIAYDGMVENI